MADKPAENVVQVGNIANMFKGLERDDVNHPCHYVGNGVECIDAMESAFGKNAVQSFCICNAFKYLFRCKNKSNFNEDLEKAKWYINKALSLECKKDMVVKK